MDLKEQMTDYWDRRCASFSELRARELASPLANAWRTEALKYLPKPPAKVLDIGCGTGFFAQILLGFEITGIDLSPQMITKARQNAPHAQFAVMDALAPAFAPNTFDAIITRNLTWTLPDLARAYASWLELLKPGGVLVNFDADYCRADLKDAPAKHADSGVSGDLLEKFNALRADLRKTQQPRPHFDIALLESASYTDISVDFSVYERIFTTKDELYNPVPIFALTAAKPLLRS